MTKQNVWIAPQVVHKLCKERVHAALVLQTHTKTRKVNHHVRVARQANFNFKKGVSLVIHAK